MHPLWTSFPRKCVLCTILCCSWGSNVCSRFLGKGLLHDQWSFLIHYTRMCTPYQPLWPALFPAIKSNVLLQLFNRVQHWQAGNRGYIIPNQSLMSILLNIHDMYNACMCMIVYVHVRVNAPCRVLWTSHFGLALLYSQHCSYFLPSIKTMPSLRLAVTLCLI